MKKLLLLLALISLCSVTLDAQLRHVEGSRSIGIGGGMSDQGHQVSLHYGYLVRNHSRISAGVAYEVFDRRESQCQYIYLNPEYQYTITEFKQILFLNLKGGLIIGSEKVEQELLSEKKSSFLFGEEIGIETEIYLGNTISFNIGAEQRFFQKELSGNKSYNIYITLNIEL